MEKQPYYIQMENREVNAEPNKAPWDFRVFANEREINKLSEVLTELNTDFSGQERDWSKNPNDDTASGYRDSYMVSIYEAIYELGDEESRSHIKK